MVGSSFFSVHWASHIHPARHGVNAEHFHRRLVGSHSGDAVSDMDLFVLIGTNLNKITKTAIDKFSTKAIWMFKQLQRSEPESCINVIPLSILTSDLCAKGLGKSQEKCIPRIFGYFPLLFFMMIL